MSAVCPHGGTCITAAICEARSMLSEVEQAVPNATWRSIEGPNGHEREASFVEGVDPTGWRFTVCAFDIAPQGFPPGTRGYDGAAARGVTVMRLTRELAEKAFKLAEATMSRKGDA